MALQKEKTNLRNLLITLKKTNDIKKIFAVTTDGAAAMVGQDRVFFALIEEKIGHPVMKYHCIIHQESLRAKIPN